MEDSIHHSSGRKSPSTDRHATAATTTLTTSITDGYHGPHEQTDSSTLGEEKPYAATSDSPTHNNPSRARSHSSADTGEEDEDEDDDDGRLELTPSGRQRHPNHRDVLASLRNVRSNATAATGTSAWSRPPGFEVTFDSPTDADDPRQWPFWYRMWTVFCVSFATWTIILYSTSYTAAIPGLEAAFHVESSTVATLGVTTFLLGLATGSLIVAPLSEQFGRRPVYLVCLAASMLLIIPCALGTSLEMIIIVRFFGALFGAAMVSNGAGTLTDISTEDDRALYMSLFSIAPLNGPVTGPLIGGFVYQYLGWRWVYWLSLILTGVGVIVMATVRETYTPTILRQRAARRRKEEGDKRYWCQYDDATQSPVALLRTNLSRPFMLAFTEPILWFFNLWISVIYGILYLCFVAYPIVFQKTRGWGPGETGLSFVGIGIGTMIAICMEPVWRRFINSHDKDPETGRVAPEASASIMSLGGILTPIGQLVFSWTCLPTSIHYAIPIAFGIPFGMGNTLCFIYGTSYLATSYGNFAASALAGNTVMRSLFGATLPLAGPTMYAALTPQWAGTLLGLLEVVLIPIPIVFWRYGARIRARSPVIRGMREEQERQDRKRARQAERTQRRLQQSAAGEDGGGGDVGDGGDGVIGVVGGGGKNDGGSGGEKTVTTLAASSREVGRGL